jgi:Skp family chaperone for outer membrane proteins
MHLKKILKVFLLFILLINTNYSKAEDNIYYIDFEYLLNNSLVGKSITEQSTKAHQSNLDNFKKTEEGLKTEEAKIRSQKNVLSKEEYKKQISSLEEKISKYRSTRKKAIDELSGKIIKAQTLVLSNITPILADYSKQNSISLILPKKNILIGKKELDITTIIIKLLNEKIKSTKLK